MKLLMIIMVFVVTFFVFQNCSPNFHVENDENTSLTLGAQTNAILVDSLVLGAEYSWSVLKQDMGMRRNNFNRIERWYDATSNSTPLYPALISGTNTLDMDHSALWMETTTGSRLKFEPKTSLTTISQDASAFLSNEFSVLIVVGNINIPTTTTNPSDAKAVRLFSLLPVNNEEAGIFTIDVSKGESGQVIFRAIHWFNGTTYATHVINLPEAALRKTLSIALRFPKDGADLMLAINGELAPKKATVVGNLPHVGLVNRRLELHTTTNLNQGSFEFAEIGIFKKAISDKKLENFSSGLYRTYELQQLSTVDGDDPSTSEGPVSKKFADMKPLFQKVISGNSCVSCHAAQFSSLQALLEAESTGKGKWIKASDSSASLVIKALRHQAGVSAMPKGGGQMEEADIAAIEMWIQDGAP